MIPIVNGTALTDGTYAPSLLAEFYADWCMECHMLLPFLETAERQTDIPIVRINCDADRDTATEFGVMSLPTLLLLENGKEKRRLCGMRDADEILAFINEK